MPLLNHNLAQRVYGGMLVNIDMCKFDQGRTKINSLPRRGEIYLPALVINRRGSKGFICCESNHVLSEFHHNFIICVGHIELKLRKFRIMFK